MPLSGALSRRCADVLCDAHPECVTRIQNLVDLAGADPSLLMETTFPVSGPFDVLADRIDQMRPQGRRAVVSHVLNENESRPWHQRRRPLSAGRVDQRVVHAVDDESRHVKRPKSVGS